jgi:hypothetical protein
MPEVRIEVGSGCDQAVIKTGMPLNRPKNWKLKTVLGTISCKYRNSAFAYQRETPI